jgi:hypothetical protein
MTDTFTGFEPDIDELEDDDSDPWTWEELLKIAPWLENFDREMAKLRRLLIDDAVLTYERISELFSSAHRSTSIRGWVERYFALKTRRRY